MDYKMKDGNYKLLIRMGTVQCIKTVYVVDGQAREKGTDIPYLPSQIIKVMSDLDEVSNILDNLLKPERKI